MPVFNSGPAFFKQLLLPPSVALSASWAPQAPRNAAVALKGLASQLGASSLHPVSGGGPATSLSASAPALCLALATPPPDSAQEEPLVFAPGAPPPCGGWCLPFFCRPLYRFGEGGSRCLVDRCSCAPRTGQTVGSFHHGLGSPRGPLACRWRHTSPRPRSRVHCRPRWGILPTTGLPDGVHLA